MATSSGAIRAGKAFVSLFADDSMLRKGLDSASKHLKAWGASTTALGAKLAAVGAVGLAGIGAAMNIFANLGSELSDMSDVTGIAIESLQELGFAAAQSGSSMEALVGGIGKMQRLIVDAAGGSAQAAAALRDVGTSIEQLAGLNPEQQFERVAAGIADIENPTERAARAMAIFGRAGARLIPTFQNLAAERANARASGQIISADEARAAEQFGDKLSALGTQFKVIVFRIGSALLPVVQGVVNWFSMAAGVVNTWIAENRSLIIIVGLVIAGVAALGVAITILGIGMSILGTVFGVASAIIGIGYTAAMIVAKIVTIAFGIVATIASGGVSLLVFAIVALVAGIAGLGIWLISTSGMLDSLGDGFSGLGDTVRQTFGGIMDAISAGDWAGAMEIAWIGIKLVWTQGIGFLANAWRSFRDLFIDIGDVAWTALKVGAVAAWSFLRIGWVELGSVISRVFNTVMFAIEDAWNFILRGFQTTVAGLIAMLPEAIRDRLGNLGSIGSVDAADNAATMREDATAQRRLDILGGQETEGQRERNAVPRQAPGAPNAQVEGNLARERREALRDINQGRDRFVNEQRAGLEARIAERRAGREAASAETQAEIAALQGQLDALANDAAMAAWEADLQRIWDRQFGGQAPAPGQALATTMASRGTFSANQAGAWGRQGTNDIPQRQLAAAQQAVDLLMDLVDRARPLVWAA